MNRRAPCRRFESWSAVPDWTISTCGTRARAARGRRPRPYGSSASRRGRRRDLFLDVSMCRLPIEPDGIGTGSRRERVIAPESSVTSRGSPPPRLPSELVEVEDRDPTPPSFHIASAERHRRSTSTTSPSWTTWSRPTRWPSNRADGPQTRAPVHAAELVVDAVGDVGHRGARRRARTARRRPARRGAGRRGSGRSAPRSPRGGDRGSRRRAPRRGRPRRQRRRAPRRPASSDFVSARIAGFSIPAAATSARTTSSPRGGRSARPQYDDGVGVAEHAEERHGHRRGPRARPRSARDLHELDEHAADPRERRDRAQRRERVVAGLDLDVRERLQERRLARVRRADERDLRAPSRRTCERVAVDHLRADRVRRARPRATCAGRRRARCGTRQLREERADRRDALAALPSRRGGASPPRQTCDAASASRPPSDRGGKERASPAGRPSGPACASPSHRFPRRSSGKRRLSRSDGERWRARSKAVAPRRGQGVALRRQLSP